MTFASESEECVLQILFVIAVVMDATVSPVMIIMIMIVHPGSK